MISGKGCGDFPLKIVFARNQQTEPAFGLQSERAGKTEKNFLPAPTEECGVNNGKNS